MKIRVDRDSNTLKMFDDSGTEMNLSVASLDIKLRPNEPVLVEMTVYVNETDIDVDLDNVLVSQREPE